MNKNELKEIIYDQKEKYIWEKSDVVRDKFENFSFKGQISIITGIRRCGKSTLQNELRYKNKESDYYLNFDDDRLFNFQLSDFQLLYEVFIELFGKQETFYFDEIQNVKGWERFVRRLHDYKMKVFITGSNASMLSKELGTHLTGRYLRHELYPFSFNEFLRFKMLDVTEEMFFSTTGKATMLRYFNEYFEKGGFPEYLKNNNSLYLKALYESILYRDVMIRYKITSEKEIKELLFYMASNATKLFTYNSLTKSTGIKSSTTVKQYLSYFEDSYFIFQVNKFDYSVKKQLKNPKKCYFIDHAIINNISFKFSQDKGRYLENMVFIELKRRGFEIFYHKEKKECDFILRKAAKIVGAVQVSLSVYDLGTKNREIEGLHEALTMYDLDSGLIITENEEDELKYKEKKIKILPAWKWMLSMDK